MSVKLEIYQDIKAKLQTLTFVKNVLHYNGQDVLNYEKDHARRFPQCWIQLTSIPWKPSELKAYNKNETQQQKTDTGLIISVYYAAFSLKEDNDSFETDLVAIDLIYRALTNMQGTNYGPMQRLNESDVPNNNNVRVWVQDYTCMLTECPIADVLVDVSPVALVINAEFITPDVEDLRYSDVLSNDDVYSNNINVLKNGI